MSYISREREIPRKNQKEMLKFKTTVTEMRNAFEGHITQQAKERTSELEERSTKLH